jgi:hypothetical protein
LRERGGVAKVHEMIGVGVASVSRTFSAIRAVRLRQPQACISTQTGTVDENGCQCGIEVRLKLDLACRAMLI